MGEVRIFLAGGSGAIGKRLVPLLLEHGHQVIATTTSRGKVEALRAAGASPVILDALNGDAVMNAVVSAKPDVVVHQMTALTRLRNLRSSTRSSD